MLAAPLLTIGILSSDLIIGTMLSLHAHVSAGGQASAIVDRWVAIGIIPTASIIVALAFLAGVIGHYVSKLAETEKHLQFAMVELQHALSHAEQANDTRAQFIAHMSHELRTPLNAVLGFSDLINQQSFGPIGERYREYVQIIHDSGAHLLGLINQVLDIAKIDAGRLELDEDDVDVGESLHACVQFVSCQADEENIVLETDIAKGLPLLFADNRMFRQILLNLLGNAVKFTPSGGTVKVSAQIVCEGLRLSIADSGIGISAGDLPHVFERFGQVHNAFTRAHNGTGLGLPLAKEFIEAHQGNIELESTPGIGTTVIVTFPETRLCTGAVAPERRHHSSARPAAGLIRA
jgi:signal transduction histidine kinase